MSIPAQGAVGAETMTAGQAPAVHKFHINAPGGPNIFVEGNDWFVHAHEHAEYREWAESRIAALATPATRTDGGMTAGEDLRAILLRAKWIGQKTTAEDYAARVVFDTQEEAYDAYRALVALRDSATPAQPAGAVPDGLRALSEAASKGRFKVVRGLHDYAVVPEAREQKGPLNSADADFAAASANHIRDILASHPAGQSAGSGAETDALVDRFSAALKVKLRAAEAKYGWKNGWLKSNWQVECQNGLLRHVGKGDPLDVAAYAAFCWHHGWPSASRRSTDFVTGAVIPTAGAIAAYETRYPEGSLSETSDNAIEAWNRVAAAVCLAEKPAPDSTRTDQVGVAVEQAVAKAAERAVEQLENAASGGLFHCEADREEAVEIVTEAIWTSPLAARPAAPEAQGADDLAERLRREIGEIRTMAADPENKAAFCELTVVADNLEALLPAPPSSGQGGR